MDHRPLILAVESATRAVGVALLRGTELVAEITTCDDRLHSERLLPALDTLLAQAGVGLDAVEAFAVSIGPGSFTGLRIGLATVKGLAFATGRPVAPVCTLAALAGAAVGVEGPAAALLDARRGQVYAGLFERPGVDAEARGGLRVCGAAELAAWLPPGCTLVPGEGSAALAAEAAAGLGGKARVLPAACGLARAARVGALGAPLLIAGGGLEAEALVPRYVRRAEAEARRTGEGLERL